MGSAVIMQLPEESTRELVALTGVVLSHEDLESTLEEVTRIAVRALPPAEGASVTTATNGQPSTVAASSEWARSLDEVQYAEHEGPCLDCWRNGTVFRVRDLLADTRWPFYAPRAAALGARSSVSLPMSSEGKIVGALNLYSRDVDAFSTEVVSLGELLAAHAGLAVQVATAFFGHREIAEQLREAMASRAVIEQAKGILMSARKVTAEEAFDLLRRRSQERNVKLRLLAEDVVQTGTLPGD